MRDQLSLRPGKRMDNTAGQNMGVVSNAKWGEYLLSEVLEPHGNMGPWTLVSPNATGPKDRTFGDHSQNESSGSITPGQCPSCHLNICL